MTTIITVDLDVSLDEHERKELLHLIPEFVECVLVLREAGDVDIDKELLSLLVGGPRLTAADVRRALADAEALRAGYRGTEWLTAKELAEFASPAGSISKVRRWQRRGQLFAIRRRGVDYFPRYALEADFHPRRAVARVMKVLSGYSADQLALWFESPSAALDGSRPREVIGSAPKRVVAAAEVAITETSPSSER